VPRTCGVRPLYFPSLSSPSSLSPFQECDVALELWSRDHTPSNGRTQTHLGSHVTSRPTSLANTLHSISLSSSRFPVSRHIPQNIPLSSSGTHPTFGQLGIDSATYPMPRVLFGDRDVVAAHSTPSPPSSRGLSPSPPKPGPANH